MEDSLDWLTEIQTAQGGWSFGRDGSADDADSTAWAITALRQHGRAIPTGPLELLQRCRRDDGGFALAPASENASASDVTAIAVRALASIDVASSEFLLSHLRTGLRKKDLREEDLHEKSLHRPCRLASRFFVSATLMDWEPGMAPWSIVNAVRELACRLSAEGAWEQALLLRCLMRLRLQSAWALVASLRGMQLPDGSWPGSAELAPAPAVSSRPHADQQGILATVTAISALAMGDLQPGLYFGSDLPFRRL
ncbi:MAG TPA: prenyltransferase/squalene oxidase repeat-containing protein [Candidatus Angelobacter sp.]|nr:prenyltransferase/squalene oxidase repeat-containing protein [Candidatus Angelobacter sp.]